MSDTNKLARELSNDEAEQEHNDIQREIAKGKGLTAAVDDPKPEEETPDEPEEVPEPKEPTSKKDDKEEPEESEDTDEDDEDLVDPPADSEKPRKKSLVDRFRETKKEKDEALAREKDKDKEIARLTGELNRTNTKDQLKDKVKSFAEKHGMSEEAALDLVLLTKDAIQPDDATRATLEESKALIQKNKAQEAFENEFRGLVSDVPEAAELRDQLRKEAYKDENLTRSLFEIYHRMQKVQTPPKKKTGESQRGAPGRETKADTFDVTAVAEKVKSGVKGALDGLTGEQQDKVFAHLDTQGSRFTR